jgi:DMSO/TMAO reductase YedYZ molybdopterin-dependent catalytic subunit
MRAGVLSAGSLAAYGSLTGIVRWTGLPGRARRFTGSYERGSFDPESMPVTQWLDDTVLEIDPQAWRLRVSGGGRTATLSFDEVDAQREPIPATIDCTGGWFAHQDWEGARLDRLLGPMASAGRSVLIRSRSGYTRRYPLSDASRLWLATRAGGAPLSPGHGSPARIVAPGRRGFWWVKWVEAVEVGGTPWWWQPPFPLT